MHCFPARYATYSCSGLIGSTYVVKVLGSRNAMMFGMMLYCIYVFAFYVAVNIRSSDWIRFTATIGALFGGWGAGFLWTAQGAYFTRAAQLYHYHNNNCIGSRSSIALLPSTTPSSVENATSKLASTFAFIYLSSEVGLRALSTLLLGVLHMSWSNLFAVYALVAILSTVLMLLVQKLPEDDIGTSVNVIADETDSAANRQNDHINPTLPASSVWYKATAAWRLLLNDRKMKYMIGLNAVFGLTSSFLTSYVNGTVVRLVLGTDTYVGVLTAWVSCVAAASSVLFGCIATTTTRKGYVLIVGAFCFMGVAGSFILYPNVAVSQQWNWMSLVGVYTLHGIGRATFEGTLKATFADYFGYEKEGAFANIILQNGLSSALGFVLTFTLHCSARKQERWGPYCVTNKDGSIHDVLSFEILIVVTALLAILGYVRSSAIRREENGRGIYENVPNTPSEQ
jgi:Ion channel regulatory protein UNC-93